MSVTFDFSAQHVWVIGGGRGIGGEIARQFAASGARVTSLDLAFASHGPNQVVLDVTDDAAVRATTQRLLASPLDVLIYAAGTLATGPCDELDATAAQHLFSTNVLGFANVLRCVAPHFKAQRHGSIVAVASNSAHAARVGMAAYGASKSALVSLTRSAGLELAPFGVRCNVVSPGSTDTPMLRKMLGSDFEAGEQRLVAGLPAEYKLGVPLGKIGRVGDVAGVVLFLASNAAGHVVLQDVVVDGGATLGA